MSTAETGMEERIAHLESDVAHMRTDIADVKVDIRSLRDKMDDMAVRLSDRIEAGDARLSEKIDAGNARLSDRIETLGDSLASAKLWALLLYLGLAGGLFGTLARGFDWI